MTTTTTPAPSFSTTTSVDQVERTTRSLVRPGLIASVVAAGATVGVAALARAADVSLQVPDGKERIPAYAFGQVTLILGVVGIVLAAVLRRKATNAHRTFLITTVALTLVSMVPPFLVDADLATSLVLCATHAIAAAIIIPVLAARLPHHRSARS